MATYFANVVWCVLEDAVKWLNQVVPCDDLVSAVQTYAQKRATCSASMQQSTKTSTKDAVRLLWP